MVVTDSEYNPGPATGGGWFTRARRPSSGIINPEVYARAQARGQQRRARTEDGNMPGMRAYGGGGGYGGYNLPFLQASLANARARMYGSGVGAQASMYGSQMGLAGQQAGAQAAMHGADMGFLGQAIGYPWQHATATQQALSAADAAKYGSAAGAQASMYGSQMGLAGQQAAAQAAMHGADAGFLGQAIGYPWQHATATQQALSAADAAKYGVHTQTVGAQNLAQMGNESAILQALMGLMQAREQDRWKYSGLQSLLGMASQAMPGQMA